MAFSACHTEEIDHSKLVVEGWIDADKHPIVILHTSYSFSDSVPANTTLVDVLAEHMVLFGKVVIFDGQDSITLTGRVDSNYLPPYIYTTTRIKGEVGSTYHLKALYKGFSATAKTRIPEPSYLDSITVKKHNERMTVQAHANNLQIGDTYAIFARKSKDKQYLLCPFGVFRANSEHMTIQVRNPFDLNNNALMIQFLFPYAKDMIDIKFAHIEEEEYQILNSLASQKVTQGVYFMETYGNIVSNITNGNGYWCGMGASEYSVRLDKDSLYIY